MQLTLITLAFCGVARTFAGIVQYHHQPEGHAEQEYQISGHGQGEGHGHEGEARGYELSYDHHIDYYVSKFWKFKIFK